MASMFTIGWSIIVGFLCAKFSLTIPEALMVIVASALVVAPLSHGIFNR